MVFRLAITYEYVVNCSETILKMNLLRTSLFLVFFFLALNSCNCTISPTKAPTVAPKCNPTTKIAPVKGAVPPTNSCPMNKVVTTAKLVVDAAKGVVKKVVPVVAAVAKKIFDARNSDEVNSQEAKKIYPPKPNEKFVPPCCGRVIPPCDATKKFRSFDGSCNNLAHSDWGVPNSTYSRLLPPSYADGLRKPRRATDSSPLPPAREIRTELFPVGADENQLWPINIMQWGQFMAHDMSLLRDRDGEISCCTTDGQYVPNNSRFCYPIKIPENDTTLGKAGQRCMNFTRTVTDVDMGCGQDNVPAKQINTVTAYMDLSNVYGISEDMAKDLRTMTNGEMKMEKRGTKFYPPTETNKDANCPCNSDNENVCYKTGDSRSNQNPQLAIQQIVFVREHNRLARSLKTINPHWNDERLFQEARRINIAAYQHISYYEWMPILLGRTNLIDHKIIFENVDGYTNDYDSSKNPDVTNEHAHAAYRQFHTQIVGMLKLMDAERQTKSTTSISNWFNRPVVLEQGTNIEQLTVGLLTQKVSATDRSNVEQISDRMLACQGVGYGIDMKATDIQRDRDHALAYYNDYRKYCGLKVAQSFEDYADLIPLEYIPTLKKLYKSYKDVDISVGGGLENLANGSQVGATFLCILNEQFQRTRQADRFWFENSGSGLTLQQLKEIRKSTSSRLFCDNGDGITKIQPKTFVLIFPGFNTLVPCSEIPSINLTMWKETAPASPACKPSIIVK